MAVVGVLLPVTAPAADLVVDANQGTAFYNFTAGAASYDNIYVGRTSIGTLNQNSGVLSVGNSGQLFVGANAGSSGTYNLSGGTLITPSTDVGVYGTGVFTLSGSGVHNVTGSGNGSLDIGFYAGSNGTYNLNGGTLTTDYVRGNLGTSTFNFNGGTLVAGTDASTDFFQNLTRANVQANGARINTANTGVTIAQSLVSGTASGTADGGLTKLGANTLTLLGNNTYTGGTAFAGGAINVANAGALGSTGPLSFTGGTLRYGNGFDTPNGSAVTTDYSARFSTAANQAYSIDTNGNMAITFATGLTSSGGSLAKLGIGTLTLLGNNTYTGGTSIEGGGTLQIGNGGTTGSLPAGAITDNGRLTYNRADNVNLSNSISGAGGVNQLGTGTLTLSGTSTYTGPTSVLAGTLAITGSITNSSNSVTNVTISVDAGATLALSGTGSFRAGNSVPLSVDGTSASPASLTLSDTAILTVKGARIGGSGVGTATQSGGTFTSTDTFYIGSGSSSRGTYTLNGGTLSTGTAYVGFGGVGTFTQGGGTFTTNGSTLYLNNSTGGRGTYTLNGGTLSTGNAYVGYGGGTGAFMQGGGTFTTSGALVVGSNGSDGTYTLSGTGILRASTTTIGNNSTFTQSEGTFNSNNLYVTSSSGIYTLGGGTLTTGTTQVGGSSSFTQSGGTHAVGTLNLTSSTGIYQLGGGTLNVGTVTNGSTGGKGTFNFNGGVLQPSEDNASFFGNLTTANVQTGGARINTAGYDVTISQALLHDTTSGAAAADGGLTKLGAGALTLAGVNTYAGTTTVRAGTLQAGVATVAGTGGAFGLGSAVNLANVAGVTLDLRGFDTQLGSLTGGGTTGGNVTLGGATLTVGTNNASPAAYAGTVSGAGNLTKAGSGTLTLSNTNTYTGTTTVNAGTLAVASDASLGVAGSTVYVLSGASLVFTGDASTTGRTFNLANGTLAPTGGGTLTYAGATVNGGVLGAGNQVFANGTTLNGVRAASGTVLRQSGGTVAFNNVFLAGTSTLTQAAGATLNTGGDFTANPQTALAVNGTVNAAGGSLTGALTVSSTGVVNATGGPTAPLYLDGVRGTTVNAGGKLNAVSGSTIELGGLLVNNGTQTGTLNVNLGGVARGTGMFGTVSVGQGGYFGSNALATGNAVATNALPVIRLTGTDALAQTAFVGPQLGATPGTANVLSLALGSGSVFALSIQNAEGTAGQGYDTIRTSGALTLAAGTTAGSRITISVASLNNGGTAGQASGFDPSQNYRFVLVQADGGIDGYNPAGFIVDISNFQNAIDGGSFSVVQQGNNLALVFTAVPEPSAWALLGVGMAGLGFMSLRRRGA